MINAVFPGFGNGLFRFKTEISAAFPGSFTNEQKAH